jgi:ferredoxin
VEEILKEAWEKHLVARPFRDEQTLTHTSGICFCCRDCCGYFLNPQELCDKGAFIESTDMKACTHCGECVEACPFQARGMREGRLVVDRGRCYGCGLCVSPCLEQCIRMVARK